MNIKETKKPLMGFAAILILVFHLFPLPRGLGFWQTSGNFLVSITYVGVDIFFFLSGYMMMYSHTEDYFSYLKRKLKRIYPMFILSVIIMLILKKSSIKTGLLTLLNIDIFINGGGSFLWFLQGLMIIYILAPFYKKRVENGSLKTLVIDFIVYLVIMIALEKVFSNHNSNIFLARIPIFVIGMYATKIQKKYNLLYCILLVGGLGLTYFLGYKLKLNYPITNIFYLVAIPLTIGIIGSLDIILSKYKARILNFLGAITLESYCLQMIFGGMVYSFALGLVANKYFGFAFSFLAIVFISYLLSYLLKKVIK